MDTNSNPKNDRDMENDIYFSKSVKAGKRIYYIDVKRDRKGEYYISMTESKRLKGQNEGERPSFEKHKLFLYREDLEKFQSAFNEAAEFTREMSLCEGDDTEWDDDLRGDETSEATNRDFRLDIEF